MPLDTKRYRCMTCGKYPLATKEGRLQTHTYPWQFDVKLGTQCPGSGTQIQPLPGQLTLNVKLTLNVTEEFPE